MLFITFFHFIETAQWRALPSASLFGALLDRTAIGQKNYIWNSKDPPAFTRNIRFFNIRMETYSSTLSVAHGPKRINFLKKLFLDFLKFFVKIKSQFEADRNLNPHGKPKNWKKKEKLWSRENGDAQDVRYSGDRKRSAVNVKKKFSKPKKKKYGDKVVNLWTQWQVHGQNRQRTATGEYCFSTSPASYGRRCHGCQSSVKSGNKNWMFGAFCNDFPGTRWRSVLKIFRNFGVFLKKFTNFNRLLPHCSMNFFKIFWNFYENWGPKKKLLP